MTNSEICLRYRDIYILLMEGVGEKTNNKVYQNLESILKSSNFLPQTDLDNIPFEVYIVSLILVTTMEVLKETTDMDTLWKRISASGIDDDIRQRITYVYDNYLKTATRKFCNKYGIPQVNIEKVCPHVVAI